MMCVTMPVLILVLSMFWFGCAIALSDYWRRACMTNLCRKTSISSAQEVGVFNYAHTSC